jgi:putative ABC transport system ATP-binding protein
MEPVIELENVWKIYQSGKVEFTALKNINLKIPSSAFISIMGASGSGKSTLLNIIGCLDSPTKGKIFLRGKDVSKLSEDELSRFRGKTIGFVFQEFNLLPNLNALENVMLPMVFQGVSLKDREKRAKDILTSLGLESRIFHQPAELSGGERQRVAVARAFANDPELVIADEPTGNLDSTTGKNIMKVLTEFHEKEGKTIIVVTHDPSIADYTEEVINIKDGEIITNHRQTAKDLWNK